MGDRSPDVVWHKGAFDREERWEKLGAGGATLWFTGFSGSGKSTIAVEVERALLNAGRSAYLLDGDNLRHGLNGDLGFRRGPHGEHPPDRDVARLMADSGTVAIVSLVSPFIADRDHGARDARRGRPALRRDLGFNAIEVCEKRDTKGFYAKARAGEMKGLTGVDAPYEPTPNPELEVDHKVSVAEAVKRSLALLP